VLLPHGDADQVVPLDDAARKAVKLLKQGTLKVVSGAPHGMCTTLADQISRAAKRPCPAKPVTESEIVR
jgi:non-heme chloroperoxidase